MSHVIDITPEGVKTEEGATRVIASIEAKSEAVYEVLRQAEALIAVTRWGRGRMKIAEVVGEYYGLETKDADEQYIEPLLEAIKAWHEANEEYLKAVAGRQ